MDADLNGLNDTSYHGDINFVKRILKKGKDVNGKCWDGCTPLTNEIRGDQKEIIILLLENGADINNNFVRDATYGVNKEIIDILCQYSDDYACKLTNPDYAR